MSSRTPDAAIKLRVTWIGEYLARPEHYDGCDGDPVRMAALDNQALLDGELRLDDLVEGAETLTLSVEVAP